MTDDPAVRLLRETLAAHELEAPTPADLAGAARLRAARAGRTRLAGLAAAAAVVLVVAGVSGALLREGGRGGGSGAGTSPAAVVPPGWKQVSSLGVQFAVPDSWRVAGTVYDCGGSRPAWPQGVVVRGGGGSRACLFTEPPTLTVVTILSPSTLNSPVGSARPGSSPVANPLAGVPASLTESAQPDGRVDLDLVLDGKDVAVLLRGPDRALLLRIAATVQPVATDSAGCSAVQADPPAWDRPARGEVPAVSVAGVVGVSVCAYSTLDGGTAPRLAASTRLDDTASTALLDALRAAPAGRNPDAAVTACVDVVPETSTVELLLTRANASIERVRVHYTGCRNRYLATETGQAQVTIPLLQAAYGPLGMGFGMSSPLG